MNLFVFPRWANKTRQIAGVVLGVAPIYLIALIWYGASPKTTDVGYMPEQPVPYSHALHAGQLGIDCRYCHNTVEDSSHAAVPAAQTCMNCHSKVWTTSPKLAPIRESYATGKAVEWIKVHDLPDYAYFNHSAHVTRGIGCVQVMLVTSSTGRRFGSGLRWQSRHQPMLSGSCWYTFSIWSTRP